MSSISNLHKLLEIGAVPTLTYHKDIVTGHITFNNETLPCAFRGECQELVFDSMFKYMIENHSTINK